VFQICGPAATKFLSPKLLRFRLTYNECSIMVRVREIGLWLGLRLGLGLGFVRTCCGRFLSLGGGIVRDH